MLQCELGTFERLRDSEGLALLFLSQLWGLQPMACKELPRVTSPPCSAVALKGPHNANYS